ncbi:MAG TPA: DUF1501 domain-containing protein [Steroidobacteraceae bacterium]
MTKPASRREFLKMAAALSATRFAPPFALNLAALGESAAAGATDYKALVCVFMIGGNDNFNTLVPYDAANYAIYAQQRPAIATAMSALTPTLLTPAKALAGGEQFALAPALAPLLPLFNGGQMAVMVNIGTLIDPIASAAAYASAPASSLPPQLFSHLDQRSFYQSEGPVGNASGWGGRIADLFAAGNGNALFTCVSPNGDSLFLTGLNTDTYSISPTGGAIPIQSIVNPLFGSSACQKVMKSLTTAQRADANGNLANLFEATYADVVSRSLLGQQIFGASLPASTVTTFPATTKTNLSAQLSMVARVIAARNASGIGATRQVFMVGAGNFDTHNAVVTTQPPLLSDVAASMAAFYAEMNALGVQNNVTSFTVSDFGRTLNSDGDGSDHGWGSVHFAVGGAVNGTQFYGTPPVLPPNLKTPGPLDVGRGRFVPTMAVDQFGATLGSWFGVSDANLLTIFPNLANFDAGTRNLGFMQAPSG